MILALTLSACASLPEAIAPAALGDAYATTPCTSARNLLAQKQAELMALSAAQRRAQTAMRLACSFLACRSAA
ncbi:MAG: hypothetical protein U5N55_07955 [Cypionkella sp.]|nr:hypothetical protein [Cypionkella sp.]